MGLKHSHLVGYGNTKEESLNGLRSCFVYYYGKEAWEIKHQSHKHLSDHPYETHWIEHSTGLIYPILWIKSSNGYKCYVSEWYTCLDDPNSFDLWELLLNSFHWISNLRVVIVWSFTMVFGHGIPTTSSKNDPKKTFWEIHTNYTGSAMISDSPGNYYPFLWLKNSDNIWKCYVSE